MGSLIKSRAPRKTAFSEGGYSGRAARPPQAEPLPASSSKTRLRRDASAFARLGDGRGYGGQAALPLVVVIGLADDSLKIDWFILPPTEWPAFAEPPARKRNYSERNNML